MTTKKTSRAQRATVSTARATSRRRSVFPPHLVSSPAEWRALKRQEWLDVTHALVRFQYGSAYTPGNRQLWNLTQLAEQITEALQGDWVAW